MRNNNYNEASRWLKQAINDLEVAKWNAKGKFWANVCFMAQQASEKALKAYCYYHGERNIIGHSLLNLKRRCKKYNNKFEKIDKSCRKLDKYYVISRYPNGLPDLIPADYFDEEEADKAIKFAEEIVNLVKKEIKKG